MGEIYRKIKKQTQCGVRFLLKAVAKISYVLYLIYQSVGL